MTSNLSSVDLSGLLQTAASQEEALQDGNAQLNAVVNQSEALAATWKGDAAAAFKSALDQFQASGTKVLNALQAMHNAMNNTHDVFSDAHNTTTEVSQKAVQATSSIPAIPEISAGLPGL